MDEFKVIVAGSRDFNDYELLKEIMDNLLLVKKDTHKIVIVSGMAAGADTLGIKYAKERNYTVDYHPAAWNEFGKRAGYLRNEKMANTADACVCFWDGNSRGTNHMINIANDKGIPTRVVKYKP